MDSTFQLLAGAICNTGNRFGVSMWHLFFLLSYLYSLAVSGVLLSELVFTKDLFETEIASAVVCPVIQSAATLEKRKVVNVTAGF